MRIIKRVFGFLFPEIETGFDETVESELDELKRMSRAYLQRIDPADRQRPEPTTGAADPDDVEQFRETLRRMGELTVDQFRDGLRNRPRSILSDRLRRRRPRPNRRTVEGKYYETENRND